MPEDLAYEITKLVLGQNDRMKQVHASAAETLAENWNTNSFLPFPGLSANEKRSASPRPDRGGVKIGASSGGQIMPPIMGAGAFIMAEITGIPYTAIAGAALIPAILYFASVFFVVDLMARRFKMVGLPRSALPKLGAYLRQATRRPTVEASWPALCRRHRLGGSRLR